MCFQVNQNPLEECSNTIRVCNTSLVFYFKLLKFMKKS